MEEMFTLTFCLLFLLMIDQASSTCLLSCFVWLVAATTADLYRKDVHSSFFTGLLLPPTHSLSLSRAIFSCCSIAHLIDCNQRAAVVLGKVELTAKR